MTKSYEMTNCDMTNLLRQSEQPHQQKKSKNIKIK